MNCIAEQRSTRRQAHTICRNTEIITIVDKSEYQKLMNYIIKKDPEAFVTVYTVSDMRYRPKVKILLGGKKLYRTLYAAA